MEIISDEADNPFSAMSENLIQLLPHNVIASIMSGSAIGDVKGGRAIVGNAKLSDHPETGLTFLNQYTAIVDMVSGAITRMNVGKATMIPSYGTITYVYDTKTKTITYFYKGDKTPSIQKKEFVRNNKKGEIVYYYAGVNAPGQGFVLRQEVIQLSPRGAMSAPKKRSQPRRSGGSRRNPGSRRTAPFF